MPALPRTYFDAPASAGLGASPSMAGWSEERKRFFMLNGYDRGPTPPETTVKVTETPPDDPTPTKRVTTTKYPEGMEQPGMQGLGLLGDLQDTTPDPLAYHQQAGEEFYGMDSGEINRRANLNALLQEQGRDELDVAGAYDRPQIQHPFLPAYDDPVTSRDEFDLAMEGRDPSGSMIIHTADDGTTVSLNDLIMELDPTLLVAGGVGAAAKLPGIIRRAGGLKKFIADNLQRLKDIALRKGTKPAAQAGSRIDYGAGFTARQLDRARAQQRLLQNAETAALIGTGVAGGTAVGLLGQPEEEGPYYEGYSPVLEEGRGASPADAAATTATAIGEDYQGILDEKQERMELGPTFAQELARDPDRLGLEEQKAFDASQAEVARVAAQDAADKQAELDRYYANFPEDIEGKRNRYLKALKEIYKKVAILNVIAALTNSPSQAGAFMQMAALKFKTLEGFRGEERLQKIARGVFFKENGEFDAPASKQDAFDRAIRFGANHDEAVELSGHKTEYAPKTTAATTYVTWNRIDPTTGEMVEESFEKGVHPRDLGLGEGWSVGQGKSPTEPAWYRSMQRIETTLQSSGREAAIQELIWFWGSDPWFRMVFGEELEAQAAIHVDQIIAGQTPPPPTEGGTTEQVITPGSIRQAGARAGGAR